MLCIHGISLLTSHGHAPMQLCAPRIIDTNIIDYSDGGASRNYTALAIRTAAKGTCRRGSGSRVDFVAVKEGEGWVKTTHMHAVQYESVASYSVREAGGCRASVTRRRRCMALSLTKNAMTSVLASTVLPAKLHPNRPSLSPSSETV